MKFARMRAADVKSAESWNGDTIEGLKARILCDQCRVPYNW